MHEVLVVHVKLVSLEVLENLIDVKAKCLNPRLKVIEGIQGFFFLLVFDIKVFV